MTRNQYFIALGIFAMNVVLKILFITETPVGVDEAFTLYFANADLSTFFGILETENNPPLFTVLMHPWVNLFGLSEFSVRILPLIFSSLTAVAIYFFGKRFFSPFVGITAAVIFTFSSFHIYFAHEARPYALFALLTILSMDAFLTLILRKKTRQFWILALLNTLLIYNHFLGFFVLLPQGVIWLMYQKQLRDTSKYVWMSWGLTFLLYTPYLSILLTRFSGSEKGTWLDPPTWTALSNSLWEFSNAPFYTVIFLALLGLGTFFFIKRKASPGIASVYILVSFIVVYLLMFAASWKIPMFLQRYLVHVSIPFYLLISLAVWEIFRTQKMRLIMGLAIGLMMILTCNFHAGNTRKDDQFVQLIERTRNKNTGVLISPEWYYRPYAYHYNLDVFKNTHETVSMMKKDGLYQVMFVDIELDTFISNYNEILLVDAGGKFRWDYFALLNTLSENFELYHTNTTFAPYEVLHFRRKSNV